ncbi:cytochrome P450 [Streptomyces sp. NPDC048664]|uniref:cytochrome P450 family protein n=1 Tax=Streptomyces sp. NPDC048664 TaxID=3154505 RepID=UPI00343FD2FA
MSHAQCPYAIDPFGSDIHGEAARLTRRGPVTPVELPGGIGAWAVSDPAVVRNLLTDPRISKDAYRHWPAWINGEIAETWPLAIWVSVQNMVTAYGDEHKRLRRLVVSAFTARRIAQLRPRIEEATAALLDDLARQDPSRPVDLRRGFAQELPRQVVVELFGVPAAFSEPLRQIINGFFETGMTIEDARRGHEALYRTMGELVAYKRRLPGQDLTSALVEAGAADETRLSDKELIDNLILLLTAGYETTVNLLDNTVALLLAHPDQLELVRSGRATWADAIEESLRVESPGANGILRYAVQDVRVGDTVIPQGDPVVISFAAAGRHPSVHGADADMFDVTRTTRRDHLAFGHGAHYCVGAPLARMEAEIALSALFARFPEMSLAVPPGELRPLESFISNGHRELPVLLGPSAAEPDPGRRLSRADSGSTA